MSTAVTTVEPQEMILLNESKYNQMMRVAEDFARSDFVPKDFHGKPANCLIALDMSVRMEIAPMMLMQNMYIVYGRPGMEAKLLIALINTRTAYAGTLDWTFEGEGSKRSCTIHARNTKTGDIRKHTLTWEEVDKYGWNRKDGSAWKTQPDIMFQYRTATRFARLYCPEVLFGMSTVDELVDIGEKDVTPEVTVIEEPRRRSSKKEEAPLTVKAAEKASSELLPKSEPEKSSSSQSTTDSNGHSGFSGKVYEGTWAEPVTDGMAKILNGQLERKGIDPGKFLDVFGMEPKAMNKGQFNEATEWLAKQS